MTPNRSVKRTFYSAPASVTSLVAAFLEPTLTVVTYLAVARWFDDPILRSSLALCLITFALSFPGRNRFHDDLESAGLDILANWLLLLAVLGLCGYATRSLGYFEDGVLLAWAVAYLRGLGAGDVWLGVNERNDGALRLYESAGFERRTTRERWARTA